MIRFLLDLLWGIPSIVYGAFGFTIMIYFGLKTSLLAGILTVTFFIIPIMVRAMDEVLKTISIGLAGNISVTGINSFGNSIQGIPEAGISRACNGNPVIFRKGYR